MEIDCRYEFFVAKMKYCMVVNLTRGLVRNNNLTFSLASSSLSISWGATRKTLSKNIREKYAKRK